MGKQEFTYPSRKSEQREFFVPGVETPEESLEVWKSFAAVAAAYPATDRKVQRLVYTSNGKEFIAEVGYRTDDETSSPWLVGAIFEPAGTSASDPWSIFLLGIMNGDGGYRNPPLLVSKSAVVEAMDFISRQTAEGGEIRDISTASP